ncbi:hypothetical protein [Actinoplanes teichomyceticus]|uniref:Uncharacterized protein n=1 Tax=Actinoplanes teichomyceticus TaxID=1867 RepID=A0A561VQ92_ACTTI|nr:hypothetical protein [Actinoplanes teichomyceticus]TWG13742.1 hypothetical protein FHX34_10429 [Actinoplanes teichomyceticus]GIF12433.1 hypothetical protein Ate01nite_24650 [Actinoplanes teichomyceticus]
MSEFEVSVQRLLTQVRHWEEPRWAAPAGARTRSDLVYGLVQRLAELGAEAEGQTVHQVPRLHDLVLPDQLRVVADDILAAEPSEDLLVRAAAAVDEVRRVL